MGKNNPVNITWCSFVSISGQKNGFHVHLQPIMGTNNEVLFRTVEYLAAGYFHNSMITAVDYNKAKITFRYKCWVDRNTKERTCSEMTLDIYEFMARCCFT